MSKYKVENQWGGSHAPWNPGGTWVIGVRSNQSVTALSVNTSSGKNLAGTMVYTEESPIGFKGIAL